MHPKPPAVLQGHWIYIGKKSTSPLQPRGIILRVFSESHVEIAYLQNDTKAIGQEVQWTGDQWAFAGAGGRYLPDMAQRLKDGPTAKETIHFP